MKPRLLIAAQGQVPDRTPIWMMRQAGRYLKGYQGLRVKYGFLECCKNSDLATEISLEPYHLFGVDGVIVFSDIMIPAEAMGVGLDFQPGPIVDCPIRTQSDVAKLRVADPYETTAFMLDALRKIKKEISGKAALIGFAGCPFTTASYMIEGRHVAGFPTFISFIKNEPKLFHELLDKLTQTIIHYLKAQVEAGADLIQIFDSGTPLLSRENYLEFAFPYEKRIMDELKKVAPSILFLRDTERFIHDIKKMEAPIVSIDHNFSLEEARNILGDTIVLQGNLNPDLLRDGTKDQLRKATESILTSMKGQRHIFNLGHGVLKGTPVDNVATVMDLVKNSA